MKLYSFDVFDTLITRNTATPQGIFAIMQQKLEDCIYEDIEKSVRENFYEFRIGAEQVARNTYCRNGTEDITLDKVYGVLVGEKRITIDQAKRLAELEEQTELNSVYGIEENIKKVKELLQKNQRVILISDMYLSKDIIHKMLCKVDQVFENITLYVSSDEPKKNKWSGNLFRLIKEKEGVEYTEWRHYGDNAHSDYKIPINLGIVCEKYYPEELLPIEKSYLENREDNADVQLAIGCSKVTRIKGMKKDSYKLGCSIGGNILYPYVNWILKESLENGIHRLYFIARDGFVLKEIADCLIEQNGYNIQTKYIYGSRIAWRIPRGEEFQKEIWEIYEHSYQDRIFGIQDLAQFFQISKEELANYIPAKVIDKNKWRVKDVNFILKRLFLSESFMKVLKNAYEKKEQMLINYLQQEIDVSDSNFAFVDLAGSGFTQECLAKVMRTYYEGEIHNYFFRQDVDKQGICINHVFYANYHSYIVLLEMICRAPHGQTISYKKDGNGEIVPLFSDVDKEAIIQHQVPEFIEGVKDFALLFDKEYTKKIPKLHLISFYLDYIYYRPDKTVLDFFADMPNMLTGREIKMNTYAPKLTDKDLKNIFLYHSQEPVEHFYLGSDFIYSLKRCTEKQRINIEKYKKYNKNVLGKQLKNLYDLFIKRNNKQDNVDLKDFLGNKVVIYGAGKKGQELYDQLLKESDCNIVLWIDKDYEKYQQMGMDVSSIENIMGLSFDSLVISIVNSNIAKEVEKTLIQMGLKEEKIFWIKGM